MTAYEVRFSQPFSILNCNQQQNFSPTHSLAKQYGSPSFTSPQFQYHRSQSNDYFYAADVTNTNNKHQHTAPHGNHTNNAMIQHQPTSQMMPQQLLQQSELVLSSSLITSLSMNEKSLSSDEVEVSK